MEQFSVKAPNWRGQIRLNQQHTWIVMTLFVLIYLLVGLLVDLYLYIPPGMQGMSHQEQLSQVSMHQLWVELHHLVSLQTFPIATCLMLVIAAVSLLITRIAHHRMMLLGTKAHPVTADSKDLSEKKLFNVVEEMKIASGLHFMPKVYVIEADYMNAFASGWSEKSAMVAITRGLLSKLSRAELQAVMAHELSHIKHMDIKLTLTVSVLSNIMLIVIDILFRSVLFSQRRRGIWGWRRQRQRQRQQQGGLVLVIVVLRFLLPLINLLLLLYLSRTREYMADQGAVSMMRDNQPLGSALMKIEQDHKKNQAAYQEAYKATAHEGVRRESYLFDPHVAGIKHFFSINDWFSTHPKMPDRLRAIGFISEEKKQKEG